MGVRIGDIKSERDTEIGDIVGNDKTTIKGVRDATISIGGARTPVDRDDLKVEDLKALLAEIQAQLEQVVAQQEALQAISAAAPFDAQGAQASLEAAAAQVEDEVQEEQAQSINQSLDQATTTLTGLLDGAKSVAEKAGQVGQAVKPLAKALEPVVELLGVAAVWAAKLWLTL